MFRVFHYDFEFIPQSSSGPRPVEIPVFLQEMENERSRRRCGQPLPLGLGLRVGDQVEQIKVVGGFVDLATFYRPKELIKSVSNLIVTTVRVRVNT